jgi:hypothetical protein
VCVRPEPPAAKSFPFGLNATFGHQPFEPLVVRSARPMARFQSFNRPSSPLTVASQFVWRG